MLPSRIPTLQEVGTGHQPAVPIPHQIAEVLADGVAMAEIVLVGQQAMEQPRVVRARRDDAHAQREQVAQRAANGLAGQRRGGGTTIAQAVRRGPDARRQPDVTGPLQLQQSRLSGRSGSGKPCP